MLKTSFLQDFLISFSFSSLLKKQHWKQVTRRVAAAHLTPGKAYNAERALAHLESSLLDGEAAISASGM